MKKTLSIAAAVAFFPIQAVAFDGPSLGFHAGQGDLQLEVPSRIGDIETAGVHARWLFRGEGTNIILGPEVSRTTLSGHVDGPRGREFGNYMVDVTGIVGVEVGRLMPYGHYGLTYIQTSMHGSDGYHWGFGVDYLLSESWTAGARWTYREFDGPAQGSDLRVPTVNFMLSWRM